MSKRPVLRSEKLFLAEIVYIDGKYGVYVDLIRMM